MHLNHKPGEIMQVDWAGKETYILNGLVRPSCLIIDEVGHCEFDIENTWLFFALIDRRYNKKKL